MTEPEGLPDELHANAVTDRGPVSGEAGPEALEWALWPRREPASTLLRPRAPVDLTDWRDPRVGWGLVLADSGDLSPQEKANAADAPEPLRKLLDHRRGSPVLRYSPRDRFTHLLRHDGPDPPQEVAFSGSERGIEAGAMPEYLLIYGGPEVIPWEVQYLLGQSVMVGRLTLTGDALDRYVDALISDWAGYECDGTTTTIWAAAAPGDAMTQLMRSLIARPLYDAISHDPDAAIAAGAELLDGDRAEASAASLTASLAERRPGLVVTTSHGLVASVEQTEVTRRGLGVPVGAARDPVEPHALLGRWQPAGAIWYAHACCSAGADGASRFKGLVKPGTDIDRMLEAAARVGPMVAPMPEALLAAEQPARAFIGHVEPTFNWTLRHRYTGQRLTASIRKALYDNLWQEKPTPIGWAFRECLRHAGELFSSYVAQRRDFDEGADNEGLVLATQLAAVDRESTVILGDPTVTLARPRN